MKTIKTTFDELEKLDCPSVTDYCRLLIKQSVLFADAKVEVYRGEMLCLTVNNVAEGTKLDVYEDGYYGPRFVKYVAPMPMTEKDKERLRLRRPRKGLWAVKDALK